MKFIINYTFTSSTGYEIKGKANIKAKTKELATAKFQRNNRDCVIKNITEVSYGK